MQVADPTNDSAESSPLSESARNRISYRSCRLHRRAWNRSGSPMSVADAILALSACIQATSTWQRSTASIWRHLGNFSSTSSCSKKAGITASLR